MKRTALIIGNSQYDNATNLKNPINDAQDISISLKKLGFSVVTRINITKENFERELMKFKAELDKSEVGLFYFAGHGVQVKGENFLVSSDTKDDDEIAFKNSSIPLDMILSYMDEGKNATNIVILDSCRDNPFERAWSRHSSKRGFASVFAPNGTLISYSTSPGHYAEDGKTNNSPFAFALRSHIDTFNIQIEELFKRVRQTVMSLTHNKQISWEHTSLIKSFKFNNGNFISVDTGYNENVVADVLFNDYDGSEICDIIKSLKYYDWYTQSPAIQRINGELKDNSDKNLLFLLGRNILQVATGTEQKATQIINNFQIIDEFNEDDGINHVLNGVLFEIYFDKEGKFRYNKMKGRLIDAVLNNSQKPQYKASIDFIRKQILPFSNDLLIIPQIPQESISIDLIFEKSMMAEPFNYEVNTLKEIIHKGQNILKGIEEHHGFYPRSLKDFKISLCETYALPASQVNFSNNLGLTDNNSVNSPHSIILSYDSI